MAIELGEKEEEELRSTTGGGGGDSGIVDVGVGRSRLSLGGLSLGTFVTSTMSTFVKGAPRGIDEEL